jgi:carboxyl-terminal processing protease
MTYSAAEDFLLGLQDLEHVTRLSRTHRRRKRSATDHHHHPELTLSIGTALTYDRQHCCIELNGLPVDGPATTFAR